MSPPLPRRPIPFSRRRRTWQRHGRPLPWWPVWASLGVLVVATVLLLHPVNEHLPASVLAAVRWLGRDWLVTLYFALAGAVFLIYYLPRRNENRPFSLSAGAVGAVLASVLGLGSYVPCLQTETAWWSSTYHTMALFVGSVHEPFGEGGSSCPSMPVSLEVARLLALGVALGALVAVLLRLFVEQVDRVRVRFAHRIVLVTGLSEETEDFVLRLKQMYDGGPRSEELEDRPEWRQLAARWLQDEYRQSAHVVVVEPNRAHPSVTRMRQAGVRIVTADPVTFAGLGRPRLGQCLSAAFLLAADSASNMRGADALLSALQTGPARQDLVPVKIMVRIDDARDAEEFRRHAMSNPTRSVIVDTFGPQQVTCQAIAALAEDSMPEVIVLAGTSALATTLLDEFAQAARERVAAGARALDTPIVVVGPGATSLVADHAHRQRWYDNTPLEVRAVEAYPDEAKIVAVVAATRRDCCASFGGRWRNTHVERPFIVDCRVGVDSALLAHRCLQRWPLGTALHEDPVTNGVERDAGVLGLHRFSPSLLRDGDVPEDRWMRAARISHERYLNDNGITSDSAGAQPWEVLNDFYRMSNLRALTHAMHFVGTLEAKRVWRPVSASQQPKGLNRHEYAIGARSEHEDWMAYYKRGDWSYGAKRNDNKRLHPFLVEWEGDPRAAPEQRADMHRKSVGTLRGAFVLLESLGYRPYLAERAMGQPLLAEQRPSRWIKQQPAPEDGRPDEVVTARPVGRKESLRSLIRSTQPTSNRWVLRDRFGKERLMDEREFHSQYRRLLP